MPSHQAIHLLQIAREALSNALKHASATEVSVSVTLRENQVRLVVADNGRGVPDHAERSNHYGLIIMRDRAQSLRGTAVSGGGKPAEPKWWLLLSLKIVFNSIRRTP